MSKMSKSIAVLGVVAGLGVAALPLSTYAANGDVSEDVELNVAVSQILELDASENAVNISSTNGNLLDESSEAGKQWNQITLTAKSSSAYKIVTKTNNADGTANLTNASGTTGNNTIPSGAPKTNGSITASAWGLKNATSGATGTFANWAAVKTTVQDFASTTTAAADDGDEYTAQFGVTTKIGQEDGTYTGTVNFTLMANI